AAEIALQYMHATTIHLVLNNLKIHCRKSLTDLFGVEFGSGTGLPFTTRRSTEVGSIKRRSKSVCLRGNAWATGASRISKSYDKSHAPGIGVSTVLGP